MNYQGKIVLITGGYQGIGKYLTEFFVKREAVVIVTYHNHQEETIKLIEELEKKYLSKITLFYLDLGEESSIIKLTEFVKSKYGKLDILINNAALSLDSFYLDKTKEEFMKVLEVNTVGTFLMMKYFDNLINNGYIFNMSSTDGIDTGSLYSIDYNASKAAINCLTKNMALVSKNKIISICPNWVDVESTQQMDQDYLNRELKRISQKKLINKETIGKVIEQCIKEDIPSGSIIRIEGDEDVRRIN